MFNLYIKLIQSLFFTSQGSELVLVNYFYLKRE